MRKLLLILLLIPLKLNSGSFKPEPVILLELFYQDDNITIYHHINTKQAQKRNIKPYCEKGYYISKEGLFEYWR